MKIVDFGEEACFERLAEGCCSGSESGICDYSYTGVIGGWNPEKHPPLWVERAEEGVPKDPNPLIDGRDFKTPEDWAQALREAGFTDKALNVYKEQFAYYSWKLKGKAIILKHCGAEPGFSGKLLDTEYATKMEWVLNAMADICEETRRFKEAHDYRWTINLMNPRNDINKTKMNRLSKCRRNYKSVTKHAA